MKKSRVEVDRKSETLQRNQILRNFGSRLLPTFGGFTRLRSSWLRIFKTGDNKYTENLKEKTKTKRKKIFTTASKHRPSLAIA